MSDKPTASPDKLAANSYTGMKLFGHVVLLLMLVAIIYTFYIVIENWSHIGV